MANHSDSAIDPCHTFRYSLAGSFIIAMQLVIYMGIVLLLIKYLGHMWRGEHVDWLVLINVTNAFNIVVSVVFLGLLYRISRVVETDREKVTAFGNNGRSKCLSYKVIRKTYERQVLGIRYLKIQSNDNKGNLYVFFVQWLKDYEHLVRLLDTHTQNL